MPEQKQTNITSTDSTPMLSEEQGLQHLRDMYSRLSQQYKVDPPLLESQVSEYLKHLSAQEKDLFESLEEGWGREFALYNFRRNRSELGLIGMLDEESKAAYEKREKLGLEPPETPSEPSPTSSKQPEVQPKQQPTERKQPPTPRKPSSPRRKRSLEGRTPLRLISSQTSKAPHSGPTPESAVKPYVETSTNLTWKSQEDPDVTKDFEDLFRSRPPIA